MVIDNLRPRQTKQLKGPIPNVAAELQLVSIGERPWWKHRNTQDTVAADVQYANIEEHQWAANG